LGVVICVRYSPKGDHLLVLRTNHETGLVQIFKTAKYDDRDSDTDNAGESNVEDKRPIAWQLFQHQALDACWTNESCFLVCGNQGLSCAYQLQPTKSEESNNSDQSDTSPTSHGLVERSANLVAFEETRDKVRYEASLGVAAICSTESQTLLTMPMDSAMGDDIKEYGIDGQLHLPGHLTAAAFQPTAPADSTVSGDVRKDGVLIACAFEEGLCVLYRITRPETTRTESEEFLRLRLDGPALALAWSPTGSHLAVGGPEAVNIYDIETLAEKKNGRRNEALVSWRLDGKNGAVAVKVNGHAKNGEREGSEESQGSMMGPSLSWSGDGESLGFALDRRVSGIVLAGLLMCCADHKGRLLLYAFGRLCTPPLGTTIAALLWMSVVRWKARVHRRSTGRIDRRNLEFLKLLAEHPSLLAPHPERSHLTMY
jgi:hypothetical protein